MRRFLCACLLLLAAGPAAASCPLPPFAAEGSVGLDQWLAIENECLDDAAFLVVLGRELNLQGRHLEAADRIERALLLAPDSLAARTEYLIALTGSGDFASAAALIDSLLADPQLPADLRASLQRRRADVTARPWQHRVTLGAAFGYDTNLFGSPDLNTLDLTLGDGILTLLLPQTYLARGGTFLRADARLDLVRLDDAGALWQVGGQLTRRASPAQPASDYTLIDVALQRSNDTEGRGHYLELAARSTVVNEGELRRIYQLAGGFGTPWAAKCHLRAGLEAELRDYPLGSVLDGRYLGARARWACGGRPSWAVEARAGNDAPEDGLRPGGDQRQYELRFSALAQIGRGALVLGLEYGSVRDAEGYSPLLAQGRRRIVDRRIAQIEYAYPSLGVEWALGVEYLDQSPSIALFEVESLASYLGVRLRW
jgi:hypothetical protein